MKNSLIVIIVILLLAGGGLATFLILKKKKENEVIPEEEEQQNNGGGGQAGNEYVRRLQAQLNEVLPATFEKLVVDGIWGPKTQAAYEFVNMPENENKLQTPSFGSVSDILSNLRNVGDFVFTSTPAAFTPGGMIYNTTKNVSNNIRNLFDRIRGGN